VRIGWLLSAGGLRKPSFGRRWGVRAVAAAAAIGLHAALIAAVTLQAATGKAKPEPAGESALRIAAAEDAPLSAIILLDPTLLSRSEGIAPPESLKAVAAGDLPGPRLVRFDERRPRLEGGDSFADARTSTVNVDGAHTALLFGRYLNQIVARIDRQWVRPRTAPAGVSLWPSGAAGPASPRFECRVRILQSSDGAVLQITLLQCDADTDWQQSLVDAIDAASPLPAPPAEAVFAHSLVLNFESAFPSCRSPGCAVSAALP
jgi:TonB C terminal